MRLFNNLLTLYSPRYVDSLVYLLKNSSYEANNYFKLVNQTKDFKAVMEDKKSLRDKVSRGWLSAIRTGIVVQLVAGLVLIYLGITHHLSGGIFFGLAVIISYPLVWAYLLVLLLLLSKWKLPRAKDLA